MHFSFLQNKLYKSYLHVLLSFCLFIISSYTYSLSNKFYHYGLHEGLSQNTVISIVQDHNGFMWFATEIGLNRFDGYEFEIYQHDANDPESLSGNTINTLLVDKKGRLWIGTNNSGVDLYDPSTKTFSHYRFPLRGRKRSASRGIVAFIEDRNGIFWIGSRDSGLIRFDEKNKIYHHYLQDNNNEHSLSYNYVSIIFEDSTGRLWIGTAGGGLNLFHRKKDQFEHFVFQHNNFESLSDDHINTINEDRHGNLWIGTQNGLNRFDVNTKTFTRYYRSKQNNTISDNNIIHIMRDTKQQLWISTNNGLNIYREANNDFSRFVYNAEQVDGLSAKSISTTYEDATGNIWIGTYGGGINRFNPDNQFFTHILHKPGNTNSLLGNSVYAIHQDNKDRIWIGTVDGGLNRYDPQSDVFTHYIHNPDDPNSISGNRVGTIYQDSKGNFWIGTYDNGLNLFNENTGRFQRFFHDERNKDSLSHNYIIDILEDYEGFLWIGTQYGGLNRFDPSTNKFTHFRHDPDDDKSISSDRIWVLHQDKHNMLWIGTGTGGLNYYDRTHNHFVRFEYSANTSNSISNDSILAIHEDATDGLWIGTANGLNYFDKNNKRFKRFYKSDGLPSNTIYSIEADDDENLWLGTTKGLAKYNPVTLRVKTYNTDDGVQSNEFNGNASIKASNGELYFGGINGVTRFNPRDIHVDIQIPRVAITRFLLNNKPVAIAQSYTETGNASNNFSLEHDIGLTTEIVLGYSERLFAFDFTALHYSNPYSNQYAYKLENWDADWIYTDYKIRRASYTNIPSGDYIFRVKASNGDGIWNNTGTSIGIKILRPFWQSWWAYSLYGVFGVLLLCVLFVIAIEKHKLEKEREYSKRLYQLDKLKDQFLANTSHELRTPLNGIIGLAENLLDYEAGNLSASAKNNLGNIIHSGKRLASLTNDILDFSKLKHNKLELQMKSIDIFILTDIVITQLKPLVNNKPISLLNHMDKDIAVIADENRLQQILYNLIGNAIKFTHQGKVEITAIKADEKVAITIMDTGIGIPEDRFESIFQSFEQLGDSIDREYGGTGIGLTVTKQLVELHGGKILIESKLGVGSKFTVILMLSHDATVALNSITCEYPASERIVPFNKPIYVGSIISNAVNDPGYAINKKSVELEPKVNKDEKFKILIVDDEEMNRLVMCNYLHNEQYELYEAVNGEEVLAVMDVMYFDLILLDVMMPKMSGFEVCEKIREKYTPNEQAIIFITARAQHDDIAEGFSMGVNDYLTKPIVKKELLVRVKTHLQLISYFRTVNKVINQ